MPGFLFVGFIQEREHELLGIQRGHLCNENWNERNLRKESRSRTCVSTYFRSFSNPQLRVRLCRVVQNHCQPNSGLRQTDFHYFSRPVLISLAYGKVFLEHAFSHAVVLSAALQFQVRFDPDFFRESAVDLCLRPLVAFPCPALYLDVRCLPVGTLLAKFFVQLVGVTPGVGDFHVAFHDFRVPDLMKIGGIFIPIRMNGIGKWIKYRIASARFRGSADLSFKMARCCSIARVTQPSLPQYSFSEP